MGQSQEHEVGMHHAIKLTVADIFHFYPAKSKKEKEDQKESLSILLVKFIRFFEITHII